MFPHVCQGRLGAPLYGFPVRPGCSRLGASRVGSIQKALREPPPRGLCPCKAAGKENSKSFSLPGKYLPNILLPSFDKEPLEELKGPKKSIRRWLLRELSSLPRSIAVLGIIAFLSSLGTFIEQGKPESFYIENYPDGPAKVLGFLTYHQILELELNHIYSAWYFWAFLWLLAAQLIACTYTRQLPLLKVARNWKFASEKSIEKMDRAEMLPNARLSDFGRILGSKGYEVIMKDASLYAFKGLAGRVAPIGVHVTMLFALAGMGWGILGGFKGQTMVPEGEEFQIESTLNPTSMLAMMPGSGKNVVHVDGFRIEYDTSGKVSQFYSDLSVYSPSGARIKEQTISVNHPIRTNGITMYQSDWSMAGIELYAKGCPLQPDDGSVLRLRMGRLENPSVGGRVWVSFIPTGEYKENGTPIGVSVLARDFQTVIMYDSTGKFAGVRRTDSKKPIVIDGMEIVIGRIVGKTGLEVKSDPGVPLVYAGFGGMMLTTMLSYITHSQMWALQVGSGVHVGGKTNRATLAFEQEWSEMLDSVPEILPESPDVSFETEAST